MGEKSTDTYVQELSKEFLYLIEKKLTPLALRLKYSRLPLETHVKWRPIVLILGNYSSGKSTLINDFLQNKVQATGQAPTDDCFTVITKRPVVQGKDTSFNQEKLDEDIFSQDNQEDEQNSSLVEEKDGSFLIHDPDLPFMGLKRHGEKFLSHFKFKHVDSEELENLVIIDTPGMLDSLSDKDRGYNYQEVISDLAQISDLILILFDAHKAGTIQESYACLRHTLPEKIGDDRLIFVLNRIDECQNLEDLLRVYGTLCWNLSQMIQRKDVPRIFLSYREKSENLTKQYKHLGLLKNQREEIIESIQGAPKKRLGYLIKFVEKHSERLISILEVLIKYSQGRAKYRIKYSFLGLVTLLIISGLFTSYAYVVQPFGKIDDQTLFFNVGLGFLVFYVLWEIFLYNILTKNFHYHTLKHLERLTSLDTNLNKDLWEQIVPVIESMIQNPSEMPSGSTLSRELKVLEKMRDQEIKEIRSAISVMD